MQGNNGVGAEIGLLSPGSASLRVRHWKIFHLNRRVISRRQKSFKIPHHGRELNPGIGEDRHAGSEIHLFSLRAIVTN